MDLITASVGAGLVVSLLLTELLGLAAGGMVAPGYLALFLDRPSVVATTFLAAVLTWLIVRGLATFTLVYGRRRVALMALVGFLVGAGMRSAADGWADAPATTVAPADFAVIGFIIPGLIALWIDRQGLLETACVALTAACVTRLALVCCAVELPA